jgi:Rrf2 family protein
MRVGKKRRRAWSATEDALVRRLAPAEAARKTGRTLGSVYARRFRVGRAAGQPLGGGPAAPRTPRPLWLFQDFGPAVRVLAWLASHEPGTFVNSAVFAAVAGVGRKHLWKLLLVLTRAGLLHSWGGPAGGYRLARPAEGITLLEVAELVDGPIGSAVPRLVTGADPRIDHQLQAACDAASEAIRRNLGRASVAQLAERPKGGRS